MQSKTLLFLLFIINVQAAEREDSPGQKSPKRPSLLDLVRVQIATREEDSRGHITSPHKKQSPKTPGGTPEEGSPGRQSPKNSPKGGLKKLFRRSHGDLSEVQKADEIQKVQSQIESFEECLEQMKKHQDFATMYELHEPTNYEERRDSALVKYKEACSLARAALIRQLQEKKPNAALPILEWEADDVMFGYKKELTDALANIRNTKKL